MQVPYVVKKSTINGAGKGLFLLTSVKKGECVWKFLPENVMFHTSEESVRNSIKDMTFEEAQDYLDHIFVNPFTEDTSKSIMFQKDDGKYFNHSSSNPNVSLDFTKDTDKLAHCYASCDIGSDEEIFQDYDISGMTNNNLPDWLQKLYFEYNLRIDTNF